MPVAVSLTRILLYPLSLLLAASLYVPYHAPNISAFVKALEDIYSLGLGKVVGLTGFVIIHVLIASFSPAQGERNQMVNT